MRKGKILRIPYWESPIQGEAAEGVIDVVEGPVQA